MSSAKVGFFVAASRLSWVDVRPQLRHQFLILFPLP
jgi:hypothetical protein